LLLGKSISLDASGRPKALYGATVHSACPRKNTPAACLAPKGCRGPGTYGNCPTNLWNNGVSWCVNANAPCYGCTQPTFPGTASLYTVMYNHTGGNNLDCSDCHNGSTGSGGSTYPPSPHTGRNYTAADCRSCHDGNVPSYTPASGGGTSGTTYPPSPHSRSYTAAYCISCHGNVPRYP